MDSFRDQVLAGCEVMTTWMGMLPEDDLQDTERARYIQAVGSGALFTYGLPLHADRTTPLEHARYAFRLFGNAGDPAAIEDILDAIRLCSTTL
jgi:hypothetical protein